MSMVYRFKEAAQLPRSLDPQAVGERLAQIRETEGAGFTPEAVLRDASKRSSPLNPAFTWDDTAAADKYRLMEAAHLVRSVVVVITDATDEQHSERAFVPVMVRQVDESRYMSIVEVMADSDYRRQFVRRLLDELIAVRRRGREFEEFENVWRAIDKTAKKFVA